VKETLFLLTASCYLTIIRYSSLHEVLVNILVLKEKVPETHKKLTFFKLIFKTPKLFQSGFGRKIILNS
jgi:hypothetical protein